MTPFCALLSSPNSSFNFQALNIVICKVMKIYSISRYKICWNSNLKAWGSRIFIVAVMHMGKKAHWNSYLAKFDASLNFSPHLNPMYLFSLIFRNFIPFLLVKGIKFPYVFPTLWISLLCNFHYYKLFSILTNLQSQQIHALS